MKTRRNFIAVLAAAVLLIMLGTSISFRAFSQIEAAVEARKHTRLVIASADNLLAELKDAESSERGFSLTGDVEYLQPYRALRDGITSHLAQLRLLAVGNDARQHLDTVAPLIDAKLAHMAQVIELRRKHDVDAGLAIMTSNLGKRLMDSIGAEMSGLIRIAESDLAQHEALFTASMQRLFATIVAASALLLLFTFWLAHMIYRQAQRRLGNLVNLDTRHTLDLQEATNTQFQQAEAELLKSGDLQSAIFNSVNFSSIATDAKGVIQIFNVGAERMLGYTAADVMNKITPAEISDPQEVIARAQALTTELATPIAPGFEALVFKASRGIEDIYELTYIRKDGSRFPAVVSVTALRDPQNAIIGYLLIVTDNTARKRVEAERTLFDQALQDKNAELESAKLLAEKANLAKSDFLSNMSHELRTPLGAILGFAQLIETGTPLPTPTQKRSIDQILKAGWYLLDLINEILDLALIESGKMSMSVEPVSLTEVMQECELMIEPQATKRGIGVAFAHDATPCFVNADRTRVKQVLINLLSNAIKYNKTRGTVSVECSERPSNLMRISVRDTGAGLTPEQLAQLFQPFNRLGHETNTEEGTGIGLVVCKRLVELMQGKIGVESIVGVGSVFWVELRLATEPQADDSADDYAETVLQGVHSTAHMYTLLYVEDNPANLMLVEDILARRPDICLLAARNGKRGIQMARASLPDVILMDINLPGISGLDALSILADDPTTAHIPVVALSANAIPRDIEKGLEAGFFRYLTKPIKVREFMDTLDVAFEFAKTSAAPAAGSDES